MENPELGQHHVHHRSFTLECTPDTFRARASRTDGLTTAPAGSRDVARCKHLWSAVGAGFWTERLRWDHARWLKHLERPTVSFWIASMADEDVGCFELNRSARGTRIEGFGLLPSHRGRGLGRDLLTAATELAFASGARKVWLHTATDDHPNALPNYLSGGYRIVRERELRNPMPSTIPFDLQPVLKGELLELRPLRAADFDDLFAVAADPLLWEQHPDKDRCKEEQFRVFFREALESGGALIATDASDGRIIGSSRFHGHDRERREIEIGWTFLARSHWGGRYNGEMKRLMLDHAFRFVDRVIFVIGPRNLRSRRAVEKIGGVHIGSRSDASGRESVVYEITAAADRTMAVRP